MSEKIRQFFAKGGSLDNALSGYHVREAQVELSQQIHKCMSDGGALIAEAGTGTGKTFAYLLPALLSDKKVIVSTGTKNLQEQLFNRDLPFVVDLLHKPIDVALLKGRNNYLCLHRANLNHVSNKGLPADTLAEFKVVQRWSNSTQTGDMGELKQLKENASIIPLVTSTVDNCLGKDCSYFEDCHLVKARKKAMTADLVVVNHHLFFADLSLKESGFGELIPNANSIIFDEAHLIPDIASEYFGEHFSTRQLNDQLKELIAIQKVSLKDAAKVSEYAQHCQYLLSDLRLAFAEEPEKGNWRKALSNTQVKSITDNLLERLNQLSKIGSENLGRETEFDNLLEKIESNRVLFLKFKDVDQNNVSLWYETTKYHLLVHLTPLSIAEQFSQIVDERDASWIFTSATIAIDSNFEHFQNQMGLTSAKTICLDSPFDYQQQAMLCVPRYLPEPHSFKMKQSIVNIAIDLIKAAKGRAFFLFTSHKMMNDVAELVREQLEEPVLVQGEKAKSALIDEYLQNASSALFATGAFWEGVDVKGDDLLCVLIDKLPFAAPDDPLLKARIDDCRKKGGKPFFDIQIPQAVISLKQGAGRLIRDIDDKGVLVICDNRLVTKPYGETFIASLPNMNKTRSLQKTIDFLSSC